MTLSIVVVVLIQLSCLSDSLLLNKSHVRLWCRGATGLNSERNDESHSAFEAIFNGLKFGYEKPRNVVDQMNDKNEKVQRLRSTKSTYTVSQGALCYPNETRLRGCQTLYNNSSEKSLGELNLQELPCVTDGSCPYSQFRCSKGHLWKGINGSPVCFHCPVCESARKVYGRKREATAERLLKSLRLYATTSGDTLLSSTIDGGNKWSSLVSLRCSEGHEWTGKVGNILLNKSGCLQCAITKKRYGEEEMHQTAEYFGGEFLGFVPTDDDIGVTKDSSSEMGTVNVSVRVRRALWKCAEGHVFNEIAGNIRRPPKGKRKCSWCKTCRKKGLQFEWNPIETAKEVCVG
jgi:hypothetical protein